VSGCGWAGGWVCGRVGWLSGCGGWVVVSLRVGVGVGGCLCGCGCNVQSICVSASFCVWRARCACVRRCVRAFLHVYMRVC